jgi:hypothetical protein
MKLNKNTNLILKEKDKTKNKNINLKGIKEEKKLNTILMNSDL